MSAPTSAPPMKPAKDSTPLISPLRQPEKAASTANAMRA